MRLSNKVILTALLLAGCQSAQQSMTPTTTRTVPLDFSAGRPTIVYKTKQDYTNKVAIMLTADKTQIASYPHPQDIAKRKEEVKPTRLAEGYLLDNQGINQYVAFTNYTFEEYAALPQTPSLVELKARIIDADPLQYLCHCGNRNQFKSLEVSLNELIAQNLTPCKILKQNQK